MQYVGRGVHNILKEWRKESGLSHLCIYRCDEGVLTIYTDRPGVLIGKGGNTVAKYRDKIREASFGTIFDVKFVETYGIF